MDFYPGIPTNMALTLQNLAYMYVVCLVYSSTSEFTQNGREFTNNLQNWGDPALPEAAENALRVFILPVGQGDATVIQCPRSESSAGDIIFIDMGSLSSKSTGFWTAAKVTRFLGNHLNELYRVYITHTDSDHVSMLESVLNANELWTKIKSNVTLIIPQNAANGVADFFEKRNVRRIQPCLLGNCNKGTYNPNICSGNAQIHILSSGQGSSSNDGGLLLRLTYKTQSMLFPGDMSSVNKDLLNSEKIAATVYKLAHHGAASSRLNSDSFLQAVSPSVVVTTGDPWFHPSYRHPRCDVLERVKGYLRNKDPKIDFSPQMTYSSGGNSTGERKEMSADGLPIFTSTPTSTSLNLIQIDLKTGNVRVTNAIRDIVTPNGKGVRRGSAAQMKKKSHPRKITKSEL